MPSLILLAHILLQTRFSALRKSAKMALRRAVRLSDSEILKETMRNSFEVVAALAVVAAGGSSQRPLPMIWSDQHHDFRVRTDDAALTFLAVVGYERPEQYGRPPSLGTPIVTQALLRIMFSSTHTQAPLPSHMQHPSHAHTHDSQQQQQVQPPPNRTIVTYLSCEFFALAFSFLWRHALPTATNKQGIHLQSLSSIAGGDGATPAQSPNMKDLSSVAASAVRRDFGDRDALQNRSAEEGELFTLSLRVLGLSQQPVYATPCLSILQQIGTQDPSLLIAAMGAAARRLDLGAPYANSALLVLVRFVNNFPQKVLPWLPTLTEAVLRCLEPSDPVLRRSSLSAATSALFELVKTFPMVTFHQITQRFAVGTTTGLIVIYDLRTATKWRILEGHTGRVSCLAFSEDGNHLASYSAGDRSIRTWQCGSTGFFGGLLGMSGKCLKAHSLPATKVAGVFNSPVHQLQTISLSWTARNELRLVREDGRLYILRM